MTESSVGGGGEVDGNLLLFLQKLQNLFDPHVKE